MSGEWYRISRLEDPLKPVPWLSQPVTRFLASLLTQEMSVLEFGSGGSTLWFAARARHVTTVEGKADWYAKIKPLVPANVTLVLWEQETCPDSVVGAFDLLLIDGEPLPARVPWVMRATELLRPGGWAVLDNANRPEYEEARHWLHRQSACIISYQDPRLNYLVTDFCKLRGGLDASLWM